MAKKGYAAAEYDKIIGQPLAPARLAEIWESLPEGERYRFVLSLDESLIDQVMQRTMPATKGIDHGKQT